MALFPFSDRFGLVAALAPWLQHVDDGVPPHADTLNHWLTQAGGRVSGGGRPLSFRACAVAGYEAHIHATGEVPTRVDNWHDAFNALCWLAWPRAKQALNQRHAEELGSGEGAGAGVGAPAATARRGPVRDALTQLDEDGVVVACASTAIADALLGFRWQEALWARRDELLANVRVLVFGHALLDKLRAPYFGLCGKALLRPVGADWLACPPDAQRADTDAWLAGCIADATRLRSPQELHPLPLLGLPGMTPDNESADYYLDTRQFRPGRRASPQGVREPVA